MVTSLKRTQTIRNEGQQSPRLGGAASTPPAEALVLGSAGVNTNLAGDGEGVVVGL